MMKTQTDRELIREFLDLVGNEKYNIQKYSKPVLVYHVENEYVKYSLWEESLLQRFGLKNVDGWDFKEDIIYAPDWITGEDEDFEKNLPEIDDEDLDNFISKTKKL